LGARLALALAAVAVVSSGCGSAGPSADDRRSAQVFAYAGCLECHTYAGVGTPNLRAPDLTFEKRRHRGRRWQVRHLTHPRAVVRGSNMPAFGTLSRDELKRLADFLEKSDGQWKPSDLWFGAGV
jgi:mono/diheme cytochrome c family protein